jgi:serine/threonine protein kinase
MIFPLIRKEFTNEMSEILYFFCSKKFSIINCSTKGKMSLTGKSITIGKYSVQVKEKIDEGGYSIVYQAEDQSNQYALKYVKVGFPEKFNQLKLEATFLSSLQPHPNLIQILSSYMIIQLMRKI